ncbi:4-hydroxyphenylacetate 3-hydroxylase family protein [Paenibacillus mucilaginosus]|uniref:4-hydroxyphenylacetate 3-hydroxylase n=3 Tax=Paenibacillus mucilaginosus TaxID=61624 RepID=H6NP52_9BACL|nr:4-hydroxyphenylacetate 3-hydroxylase N-terminal domain-containing protein [Paenibacillus mucilaginosus]AEI43480.1 4-hydroxyphenylacetate 3-hydroxylase [Paenibacillus mucilaginosus KNP414]AFC31126.1 4-hydroxyphenylacetate 3-hydroxylase [Paenibacillus mucilaginosus 3016]AFH63446.1 4-hydroxyphenylacetate 3-hydroxylase [Paenibacillus mucilaginosus K02]MCG7211973.1 4-hydroxyphenylacetate 3-hydroxylase [Paenibacillus mucilaginosus]WDM25037.1 4-hydroxyphenylacetate 3-hydroxylase [Paenibacillus muc
MRGERFLESLNDGRTVWLGGTAVSGLPEHPAFKGTLTTITRLFNMLDDPALQDEVGYPVVPGGRYAHSSFLVPCTQEQLAQRSRSFSVWSKSTHGMMSRLSDYARSLVTGWYAARDQLSGLDPGFGDKITAYYEAARDNDLFLTTAIIDPQIDRSSGLDDERISERFLHVVRETGEGLVLRGAKMIATGAPYTHDFIISSFLPFRSEDRRHAHVLLVPANSPGLHIVCRESFASAQEQNHPLSAQYDEMDAVLFFDDVLVPWERVLLYGSPEDVLKLRANRTANGLAFHQNVVRYVAKLEFITGVAFAMAESIGTTGFLHIQEKLGELLTQIQVIRALVIASEAKAMPDESGVLVPDLGFIETARNVGTKLYPRAVEILQQVGGGGFVQAPSGVEDFYGPISGLMHLYYEGAGVSAEKKVQLLKLAWDLIGSPLGARHELYERFYAGDPVRGLANQYLSFDKSTLTDPVWKLLKETSRGRVPQ